MKTRPAPTEPRVLRLPGALRERLEGFVLAGYPRETCGTLLGRPIDPGRSGAAGAVVTHVEEGRNLDVERARDRYQLDPEHLFRAEERARREGLEVVGVWHSHPEHPARPSETDRAAAWEGWSYLIASVDAEAVRELRSWRLADGWFIEEEVRP